MRDLKSLLSALVSLAMVSEVVSSQAMGDLCSGGLATGTGLRGAYHSDDLARGSPQLVRIDASVSSDTFSHLPAKMASHTPKQVRWCGWIRPIVSGPHRFSSGGGSLRIEVDRKAVAGPPAGKNVAVNLEAGKSYPIRIELDPAEHTPPFVLQWTPPFGATFDIPPTVLFPPVETVKPGC